MFKYNLNEIKGKSYQILLPLSEMMPITHRPLWARLRSGKSQRGVFKRINKHRKEIWINASYTPVKNEKGKFSKIILLAIDVTEQKKLSIDYEEQLAAINRSNAIVEYDIYGRVTNANDVFLDLAQYKLDEIIGKHHSLLLPEDEDAGAYETFWQEVIDTGYKAGIFRRTTQNGSEIWIKGSYSTIRDSENNVLKIIQFAQNITKQKSYEAQLTQTNEMLKKQNIKFKEQTEKLQDEKIKLTNRQEDILKEQQEYNAQLRTISTTLPLAEFDAQGRVLNANQLFLDALKYSLPEIKGKSYAILLEGAKIDAKTYKNLWLDLQKGNPKTFQDKYLAKDGTVVWWQATYTPMFNNEGKVYKILQLAMDVRHRQI